MKSLWRKSIRKKWIFKRFASKCRSRMYLFATCNVNIWHEIQISMCILASFIVINMPLFVALKLAILVLDQRNELILIYRNVWKFEKKIEKILYLLVLSYSVEVTSFLFLKIRRRSWIDYENKKRKIFSRAAIDSWIFVFDSRINRLQSIEAVFTRSTVNLEFVTGFAAARANTLLRYLEISKRVGEVAHAYMYARTPKGTCIWHIYNVCM